MSQNIHQVFTNNPITTNQSTDLMYFGRSPYGVTDDTAMTYQNFAAQFANKNPTIQRFFSGSGTYTTPVPAPLYIVVYMVGGGGGGQGGGATPGPGTAGGNTTFGTSFLVANGGSQASGPGGTVSIGSGASGIAINGGVGGQEVQVVNSSGGNGASSALGGGAAGGTAANAGGNAAINSGSGGGGGGASASAASGAGGSAGGYVQALINAPVASYPYAVGTAGSGGAAGTSGGAGGNGGSGLIVVFEYYQ